MRKRPLIGVTSSFDAGIEEPLLSGHRLLFLSDAYILALELAGASAVVLPICDDWNEEVIETLDGLLISGNEKPLQRRLLTALDQIDLRDLNAERYDSDERWLRGALSRAMPVLGICRGHQTLNAVLGGTIDRLPALPEGKMHAQNGPWDQPWHDIDVLPDSLLARVLGQARTEVNSLHVQGVGRPGTGVRFTAFAPCGSVEALECPAYPFVLGVQFHPEKMIRTNPIMSGIFTAFVGAAAQYHRKGAAAD